MFYRDTCKPYPDLNYFINRVDTYLPRHVKIEIIQDLEIHLSTHSDNLEEEQEIKTHSQNNENQNTKIKFQINNIEESRISNDKITEFNTHPLLKKINSSYHLKRKISTKLQNEIRETINQLIKSYGGRKCLPYLTANSKEFRENVKNESLRKLSQLSIGKYICEEYEDSKKIHSNKKVIERIEELYSQDSTNPELKKMNHFINKTIVKDYFIKFLTGNNFKKCLEKDLAKYKSKIYSLLQNESEVKKQQFVKIYAMKYEEIAKNYFN